MDEETSKVTRLERRTDAVEAHTHGRLAEIESQAAADRDMFRKLMITASGLIILVSVVCFFMAYQLGNAYRNLSTTPANVKEEVHIVNEKVDEILRILKK